MTQEQKRFIEKLYKENYKFWRKEIKEEVYALTFAFAMGFCPMPAPADGDKESIFDVVVAQRP